MKARCALGGEVDTGVSDNTRVDNRVLPADLPSSDLVLSESIMVTVQKSCQSAKPDTSAAEAATVSQ